MLELINQIQKKQFGAIEEKQLEKLATYMPGQMVMIRFRFDPTAPNQERLYDFNLPTTAQYAMSVMGAVCASGSHYVRDVILMDKELAYTSYEWPMVGAP